MKDLTKKPAASQQTRKVQAIVHVCSTEACGKGAPYGFKDREHSGGYRWSCADHIGEGEIILSDGSKRIAVRGRGEFV